MTVFYVQGRQTFPVGFAGFGARYNTRTAADAAKIAIQEHPSCLTELHVYKDEDLSKSLACLSLKGNPFIDGLGGEGADGSVLDEHGAVIGPNDWRWEHNHPWFSRKPWWRFW